MNTKLLTTLIALVSLLVGGFGGWYVGSTNKTTSTTTTADSTILKLPNDAKPGSRCVTNHGLHYSVPSQIGDKNDPFIGPSYLQDPSTGKIVAIEYHIKKSSLDIADALRKADYVGRHSFELGGVAFNHLTISYNEDGHPGYEVPHYDIHVWNITGEQRAALKCPEATPPASTGSAR